MDFEGTHGTSLDVARKIENGELFHSALGRRGTGAYFWMQCDFAFSLAKAWWFQKCREGRVQNLQGAVILVKFVANEEAGEVFDLVSNREHINRLITTYRYYSHILKTPDKIARFYADFFMQLDKAGVKVKVIISTFAAPEGWEFPVPVFGSPVGYVVRDTAIINWLRTTQI